MAREDLLVAPASGNPFAHEHRPNTDPTIAFPVQNPQPHKDRRYALRMLANLVAVALGASFFAILCKPQAFVIPLVALLLLPVFLLVMFIEQSLRVLPSMLLSLATAALWLVATQFPDAIYVLTACGLVLLHWQAFDLRWHYLAVATAGMLDTTTIRDFRRHHRLPKGLKAKYRIAGLFDAVVSYFSYNRRDTDVPGVLLSPAGSFHWRLSKTVLCIATLSFTSTLAFLAPASPRFTPATDNIYFGFVQVWLVLLANPLMAVPLWLIVCGLWTISFVGKAYALKCKQMSPRHYRRLVNRIQSSPDKLERESIWLGMVAFDRSPILYLIEKLLAHVWVVGKTGSGKTAWLMFLVDQLISRDDISIIYLDLKAFSNEVLGCILQSTQRTERRTGRTIPFKHFGLIQAESSYLFDIFSQRWWATISAEQRTGVLLSTMSILYSRAYGHSWYTDTCFDLLLFVLERHPDIKSWTELYRRTQEAIRHARPWELSDEVKRDGTHVLLIIKRLARLNCINADHGHSPDVLASAIDFADAFQSPCHYYFGIGAIRSPLVAGEVGRLVLGALLQSAVSTKPRRTRVIVVIDEFHELVTEHLSQTLTMARGCGIGVILANQTTSQLVTPHYDLRPVVEGNTDLQAWLATNDAEGREQMRRLGGQEIIKLQSVAHSYGAHPSTTFTAHDHIQDRLNSNFVSNVSSDPNRFVVRITENAGYACYEDLPFSAVKMFHQSKEAYEACVAMPWPAPTSETLVNGSPPPLLTAPPQSPQKTLPGATPAAPAQTRRLGRTRHRNP